MREKDIRKRLHPYLHKATIQIEVVLGNDNQYIAMDEPQANEWRAVIRVGNDDFPWHEDQKWGSAADHPTPSSGVGSTADKAVESAINQFNKSIKEWEVENAAEKKEMETLQRLAEG